MWSLGVILHELLTGKPVFVSESATELLAMIVADPPTPLRRIVPTLPASLEATVLACLEKPAAERLPDVATLARRLQPLAPRWAVPSVERILGFAASSASTVAPPTGPAAAAPGDGDTLPLPPGATTSAQLSGELVSAEEVRRRSKGLDSQAPSVLPSPTDTQPLKRRRGVLAGTVIGGVIAVTAAALVLLLGRSPLPRNAEGGTQPPPDVSSVRMLEKPAAATGAPAALEDDARRAAAPAVTPTGSLTPEQPGVKVRDMSPEELVAADAKIAARLRAAQAPKLAKQEKVAKPRATDPPRARKAASASAGETALAVEGPAGAIHAGKPSARPAAALTAPPEAKDPLDGRQ